MPAHPVTNRVLLGPRPVVLLALLGCGLNSCAAPSIPPPRVETSPLAGRLTTGTVLAVRPVDLSGGRGDVNAVLSALGEAPRGAIPPAEEVIIRRQDNSVTAITEPQAIAPGFAPGEPVSIVEAAATVLRPD